MCWQTTSSDNISKKSVKVSIGCDCCSPTRWLLLCVFAQFGGQSCTETLRCLSLISGLRLFVLRPCLLCSFPPASPRGLRLTLLVPELRAGCLSPPLTEHPRCCFLKKNHKWALNDFNLPARSRTERGKNNQHQFCQLSSLCLLGCSQLAQIQLLRKPNERPHNCLDDTLCGCWSLLLHP